jgi:hypothetical protein
VSRRPTAAPRPGWGLFLAAFLLSPLVVVAWLAGAAMLRATGWPRWRRGRAIAAAGVVVWLHGGPVPALTVHFSGYWQLLRQFGAAQVRYAAAGGVPVAPSGPERPRRGCCWRPSIGPASSWRHPTRPLLRGPAGERNATAAARGA